MKIKFFGEGLEIEDRRIEESSEEVGRQVKEFLEKERKIFDLSFSLLSGFTGEVMREIQKIPYGETKTYGFIASGIGSAPVAVGQACGSNALPLIVPCHRVVGENSISGYRYGKELKRKLLDLERE